MATTALLPIRTVTADVLPARERDCLAAWFSFYMGVEAGANADNTVQAKARDLQAFLAFFQKTTGRSEVDLWTRSVIAGFIKHLQDGKRSPTTINRVLATIRHCAKWIHQRRQFLAGNPAERIQDLRVDDPNWKGLKEIEITRLKAAAEQLVHVRTRRSQQPIRDLAIFLGPARK